MKKFSISLIVILAFLIMPIVKPFNAVLGQEKTMREQFDEDYIAFSNSCNSEEITEQNIEGFINLSYNLLGDCESIIASMTKEEFLLDNDLRGKYITILTKYGSYCKTHVEYNYFPENYAPTTNGSIKLNNEYRSFCSVVSDPNANREKIYSAYNSYFNLLNSGELAQRVASIQTNSDAEIKGEVASKNGNFIFSPDDKLVIKKFNSKTHVKNLNNSLIENEGLTVENGGVAYYFDLIFYQDGIVRDTSFDEELVLSISLESLGLEEIEDGSNVQIAKYNGNGNVEFYEAKVVDGLLVFEITKFERVALIAEGYRPKNSNMILAFFNNYYLYVIIGAILIFIIIVYFKIRKCAKNRARKKELKEFRKYRNKNKQKGKRAK